MMKVALLLPILRLTLTGIVLPNQVLLANNTPNQIQDQQDLQRYIDRESGVSYGPGLGSASQNSQDPISKAESDLNTKAQENSNLTQNNLPTQSSLTSVYSIDPSYDILSGEIIKGTGVITIPQFGERAADQLNTLSRQVNRVDGTNLTGNSSERIIVNLPNDTFPGPDNIIDKYTKYGRNDYEGKNEVEYFFGTNQNGEYAKTLRDEDVNKKPFTNQNFC